MYSIARRLPTYDRSGSVIGRFFAEKIVGLKVEELRTALESRAAVLLDVNAISPRTRSLATYLQQHKAKTAGTDYVRLTGDDETTADAADSTVVTHENIDLTITDDADSDDDDADSDTPLWLKVSLKLQSVSNVSTSVHQRTSFTTYLMKLSLLLRAQQLPVFYQQYHNHVIISSVACMQQYR